MRPLSFDKSWVPMLNIALAGYSDAQTNPLQYVNTQIGATDLGHVFAGASLPYGMAKAVGDTTNNNRGGFALDGQTISGFSHMHDTGTGGGSSMGFFPIFPYAGCANDVPDGCAPFSKLSRAVPFDLNSIIGTPGYWSVVLGAGSNVRAEMTVTRRVALYRFTFPSQPPQQNATLAPFLLVDLTDLYDSKSTATITVDQTTGRMMSSGTFQPGFGVGSYEAYTCTDFNGAPHTSAGIWQNSATTNASTITVSSGQNAGAWIRFGKPANKVIFARVGISFISTAQACQNAQDEMPTFGGPAFGRIRTRAETMWKAKLNAVSITPGGASDELLTVFWSGIYRSMISPQDYTGENQKWTSAEPYFDSFYCIWDSFRAQHPLLTVLDPVQQTRMVRGLIDIYRHEGYLPDCHMQFSQGYVQGGSNAEVMLTDSYLKGISDGVDWPTAFQGMVKDAEVEASLPLVAGRYHLASYKKLGYCPINDNDQSYGLGGGTISRTVEYAYNDYCIAEMAKKMGNTTALKLYRSRSSNWARLFNPNTTSMGFKGFLQPRLLNGNFVIQDPTRGSPANNVNCCGSFFSDIETYEGSAWSYSFYVPSDMASLITAMGGATTFVRRLDYMHENNLLDIGDEQAFLNVWQYHYAGRPGRSTYRVHSYIPSRFNTSTATDGIPGNDDGGAMGAFASWSLMGLFPNPGQNVYFIGTPFFESVSIISPATGKTATITNTNFDPSYKNIYIQSAKLNGAAYTKNWITHSFFTDGGTLELTLGPTESTTWGKGAANIPPSFSTNGIVFG